MPRIITAARAVPAHAVQQSQVREVITTIFRDRIEDLSEKLELFANTEIKQRYLVRPPAWYLDAHTAEECNKVYIEEGTGLLQRATENCLEKSGLGPGSIDHVISVSTTGMAAPTLESRIYQKLGLRAETGRTPVWGLGCAAGAAGLALAADICRGKPQARVLLLALECCSLTFRRDDASMKNLVGTALFGDGAAAVLVAGEAAGASGPEIVATRSKLFPDSGRIMGWDLDDHGMQLVLSPHLPRLVEAELAALVDDFLAQHHLAKEDLRHYLLHPGGARVLAACKKALQLNAAELALSEDSLRQYGNVSSVSILMILEDWLATEPAQRPGYGMMAAFGPGFSAEMLLLEV